MIYETNKPTVLELLYNSRHVADPRERILRVLLADTDEEAGLVIGSHWPGISIAPATTEAELNAEWDALLAESGRSEEITKMYTPHPIQDEKHVNNLADSMTANGWVGAPVVCFDDLQITGTHRAAAAERSGIEIQTIQLSELFAEDGADWEEAINLYNQTSTGDAYSDITCSGMLNLLSSDIRDKYGIDLG